MSSLLAPQWSRTLSPRSARSPRPSLREVCLVGSARPDKPSDRRRPSIEETIPHLGRIYRVAEAQDARPRDGRHYLHLIVITPGLTRP